jgi:hypothetical protein
MENKILYSITGIFSKPDDIINAVEKIAKSGYKNYDVNTPYPIHGMDSAMKLKPSLLGYFALVFGLTGAITALIIMWWTGTVDYPLVIGGKPTFVLPAFIPVTFELTVLIATIGTVLTMLFLFFKLPNNAHPLHDTDYMKKVSNDKFGISIEAKDPKFNEKEVEGLLKELGADEVNPIHYNNDEIRYKPKIFDLKFMIFLFVAAIATSGASYFTFNKLMFMVPFNWMAEQDKTIAQYKSTFFKDGFAMRQPVKGTVARGFMPYQYHNNPEEAEKSLINPISNTKDNLEKGRAKFNTFCSPCHGYFGKGDSRLNGQFPNPPSLHSDKVRNWQDGRIFHIITDGQNAMPSYAKQLSVEERWKVVSYVRALQRAMNAKEEDLK